jgi:hypothetical protein
MIKHLPNALTVARFILAPIVAYALYIALSLPLDAASEPLTYPDRLAEAEGWALLAAGLFVFAALTDLFDGMAARALQTNSKFGRILDPIADKALVGLPLLAVSVSRLPRRLALLGGDSGRIRGHRRARQPDDNPQAHRSRRRRPPGSPPSRSGRRPWNLSASDALSSLPRLPPL